MLLVVLLQAVFGSGVFLLACTLLQFIMPGQAVLGSNVAAVLWDVVDKLFSTIMSLWSVLGKNDECKLRWVGVTWCGGFGVVLSAGGYHLQLQRQQQQQHWPSTFECRECYRSLPYTVLIGYSSHVSAFTAAELMIVMCIEQFTAAWAGVISQHSRSQPSTAAAGG